MWVSKTSLLIIFYLTGLQITLRTLATKKRAFEPYRAHTERPFDQNQSKITFIEHQHVWQIGR